MAEWRDIPGGMQLHLARSPAVSCESLTNWYVDPAKANAKRPLPVYPPPGLSLWSEIDDAGSIRGLHAFGTDLYVVADNTLYVIDKATKAQTELGAIARAGAVRMINNGEHVVIATTVELYAANRADGVLLLPESNMAGMAYQDGYVIYAQAGTQRFYISGLDDATTIDALDFSTADAFPDNLVGLVSDHRGLLLFGEETVEGWYNSGDSSFPFARQGGGFIEQGCLASGSIAKAKRRVFFLGNDLTVYAVQGFQAEPITTPDVQKLIADATDPEAAEGFTYTIGGNTFYVLSFADLTLEYNLATGLWHKRKSWGLDRWRASCFASLTRTPLVGSVDDGRIFELDLEAYDEDGDPIEHEMQLPPASGGARDLFFGELFVDVEAGVGLATGQGSDPQLMLDWSDDDGRTFGNEMTESVGAVGEYRRRVTFPRLGKSRSRTFRIRASDPVNFVILGIEARVEAGL